MEALAAKLILLETPYSTVSEPVKVRDDLYRGTIHFHGLPPGSYSPVVYRTGCKTLFGKAVTLKAGEQAVVKWDLEADAAGKNLVRNPDFSIRWTGKARPEHWQYAENKGGWVSDNIRVTPGQRYRTTVKSAGTRGTQGSIQWMQHHAIQLGGPVALPSADSVATAPAGALYGKVIVAGRRDPAETIQHISMIEE